MILLFFLLFQCNDYQELWQTYTIEQGEHYANRPRKNMSMISGDKLVFKAIFDESTLNYPIDDDLNKLYGFTDCNSLVHKNSIRFAWKQNQDSTIGIYAYWYVDGKRGFEKLTSVKTGSQHEYLLMASGFEYFFQVDNVYEYSVPRSKDCAHGVRARLFPYYGGNKPAPKRMVIHIYEY